MCMICMIQIKMNEWMISTIKGYLELILAKLAVLTHRYLDFLCARMQNDNAVKT